MLPLDEAGAGPAVCLLHAGITDRTMWSDLLPWLAQEGYRAIAPDLPGFGEAEVGTAPQAPWDDVLMTLEELGVHRAVLVGVSFGGAVALRVASLAPDRVASLVLVSAPPLDLEPSPELARVWEAEEAALESGDLDAAARVVAEAWTRPGEVRARVQAAQRRAFALQRAAGDVAEAPDPLDLARVTMPVVVAAGEYDLPDFRDPALAASLGVELQVLPGAGHLAPLEAPEAFRALLRTCL